VESSPWTPRDRSTDPSGALPTVNEEILYGEEQQADPSNNYRHDDGVEELNQRLDNTNLGPHRDDRHGGEENRKGKSKTYYSDDHPKRERKGRSRGSEKSFGIKISLISLLSLCISGLTILIEKTNKVVFRKITQNTRQGGKLGTTLLLITWNLKRKPHPRSHSSRLRQASSRSIKRPRVLALKITADIALSGLGQLEVTALILYMTHPRSPKALHTHSLLPNHRMPSPSRGKSARETIRPIMKNWTLVIAPYSNPFSRCLLYTGYRVHRSHEFVFGKVGFINSILASGTKLSRFSKFSGLSLLAPEVQKSRRTPDTAKKPFTKSVVS
jgi:hypothetical protein